MFIQMLPPWKKFPEFTIPMNHALGFTYYGAKWIDQVLMKWIKHIISLFDDSFKVQGVPEEFFVTIAARWIMAIIHSVWTFIRVVKTLAIPIGPAITSSDYLIQVFSVNKVLEQVNLAIVGTTDLTAWFLKVQHELTMTAVDCRVVSLRLRLDPLRARFKLVSFSNSSIDREDFIAR